MEGSSPLVPCLASVGLQGRARMDASPRFAAPGRRVEPTRPQSHVCEADRRGSHPRRSGPKGQGAGVSFFSGIFLDKQENTLVRRARRRLSACSRYRRAKYHPAAQTTCPPKLRAIALLTGRPLTRPSRARPAPTMAGWCRALAMRPAKKVRTRNKPPLAVILPLPYRRADNRTSTRPSTPVGAL
jgi:hypothetical protein